MAGISNRVPTIIHEHILKMATDDYRSISAQVEFLIEQEWARRNPPAPSDVKTDGK